MARQAWQHALREDLEAWQCLSGCAWTCRVAATAGGKEGGRVARVRQHESAQRATREVARGQGARCG
eukprot:250177-Chlamydomonas_euryale.AAC.3